MNIINDQLTFTLKYRHKKGFVVFQVTCQSELKDLLKFIGNHGYDDIYIYIKFKDGTELDDYYQGERILYRTPINMGMEKVLECQSFKQQLAVIFYEEAGASLPQAAELALESKIMKLTPRQCAIQYLSEKARRLRIVRKSVDLNRLAWLMEDEALISCIGHGHIIVKPLVQFRKLAKWRREAGHEAIPPGLAGYQSSSEDCDTLWESTMKVWAVINKEEGNTPAKDDYNSCPYY